MSIKIDQDALRGVVEKVMADLGRPVPGKPDSPGGNHVVPARQGSSPGECSCHSSAGAPAGRFGVFDCVNSAANAAHDSFVKLKALGVEGRSKVSAVRIRRTGEPLS